MQRESNLSSIRCADSHRRVGALIAVAASFIEKQQASNRRNCAAAHELVCTAQASFFLTQLESQWLKVMTLAPSTSILSTYNNIDNLSCVGLGADLPRS